MQKFLVFIALTLIFAFASLPAKAFDKLMREEVNQIGLFKEYGITTDAGEGTARAREIFGGRGPALAHYFLHHQSPPYNDAYFFLFGAVGDVETAQILIRALPNPPEPEDSVLPRHAGEIEVAVEKILEREDVRSDPAVLKTLTQTLTAARKLAWGDYPAELLISLMGKLKTAGAAQVLQKLAKDSDPAIRVAAIKALGETGTSSVEQTLSETMRRDESPSVRAEAAKAIKETAGEETVSTLLASLKQETDLAVVDSILQSVASLQSIPEQPEACLTLAKQGWDIKAVRPFFNCWRQTASAEDMVAQAVSGPWAVRALALEALTEKRREGPLTLNRWRVKQPPVLNKDTKTKLLESAVEILSQDMLAPPGKNSIAGETAYMTKQALWDISGHDMALALSYADRIEPLTGRYDHIGRFGASDYLASEDEAAYTAIRRPGQMLSAGLLMLACLPLLGWPKTRKPGAGMIAGTGFWILTMAASGSVHEFPPPPLGFLTIPAISFLIAGLVSGAVAMMQIRGWIKLLLSPLAAGITASVICGYTRSQGLYPIGSGGWELFSDPVGCALLAAPAAFLIALGLLWIKPKAIRQA